jgi:hypothetical protein
MHLTETKPETKPYRIGWWTHAWWPTWTLLRCLVTGRQADGQRAPRRAFAEVLGRRLGSFRRPHRPWQSEAPTWCRTARRGFTATGAQRKMERDVLAYLGTGQPSRWQRRRAA